MGLSRSWRLVPTGLLASALVVLSGAEARAEGEHARLRYELDDPRAACADEATFRARVAGRVGYDAFRDDAVLELRVKIVARPTLVTAEITAQSPGKPPGRRTLEDPRCEALGEAVASAVALVLDPVAASAAPPEPEAAPLPPPALGTSPLPPPAPFADRPAPAPVPATTTDPLVYADLTASLARTPAALLGARVGVGLHRGVHSLALEGRAETSPTSATIGSRDRIDASAFSGAIVPCRHFGDGELFVLCGVATAGLREVKALDVVTPAPTRSAFVVLGVRAGLELALTSGLALRANGEVGASLLRDTYTTDGVDRATTSVVEASLGTGLVGRFR